MKSFISSITARLSIFGDKSAFLLIVPFALVLYLIDSSMLVTLLEWLVFAPVLAGIGILVSRLVFPHINLTRLLYKAERGNRAAGAVAGALIVFVGLLLLALVLWAKA